MTTDDTDSNHFFRPKARILILLGEQLIKDEVVAISELVKNSYDANATSVSVEILHGDNPEVGEIIVLDNGVGMSKDTVLNVWLEPATDFRIKQRVSADATGSKRRTLGEKGIGRFAAHKLGYRIELVTRSEDSKLETVLDIDWRVFESNEYLDQIPVSCITREPKVFTRNTGTRMRVRKLYSKWTETMVRKLLFALQSLTSPFNLVDNFVVKINAPEFANVIQEIPQFSEVVKESPYLFRAEVSTTGMLTAQYRFRSKAYSHLDRTISLKKNLEKDIVKHMRADGADSSEIEKISSVDCGPLSVQFHVWDLDPKSRSEIHGGARYYNLVIKPQTGIRLYRDKFRVWPYGEKNNDWLSMDLRRVNNPTQCISRNQVIGLVDLSGDSAPNLRDKTNREGLVENDSFRKFERLVVAALSTFEIERRKDRQRLNALRSRKSPKDKVIVIVDRLKRKVAKNSDEDRYQKDLAKLTRVYARRVRELLDPYLVQASLGIAYSIPIHEMRRDIRDLKLALKPIEDKATIGENEIILKQIDTAMTAIKHIASTIDAVRRLLRKTSKDAFKLSFVAKTALSIVKSRATRIGVDCTINIINDSDIKGNERLIIAAVLNLLDNSLYWVRFKGKSMKIRIVIDHDEDNNPRLVVSDSGPGFEDDLKDVIQPFFTRKPDGSGLGLHIVDTIMKEHDGAILLLGHEARFLKGANVALVFGKSDD